MRSRLTVLFCSVVLLSLCAEANASTPDERTWEEKQAGGLSVSRHAVATASVNVALLPFSAATCLVNAPTQNTERWRRMSYAIGSATAATAAANLGWLVVSGMSLSDYRDQSGEWMTVRRARTNVGFVTVDTTLRTMNLIGGAIAESRGNAVRLHAPDPQCGSPTVPRLGALRDDPGASVSQTRNPSRPASGSETPIAGAVARAEAISRRARGPEPSAGRACPGETHRRRTSRSDRLDESQSCSFRRWSRAARSAVP